MAQFRSLVLRVAQSPSPDVSKYYLFVEQAPAPVTYDSQRFELAKPSTQGEQVVADLSALMPAGTSGAYNIGIAPANEFGNIGDMVKAGDVPLDLTAPAPCPGPILWAIV